MVLDLMGKYVKDMIVNSEKKKYKYFKQIWKVRKVQNMNHWNKTTQNNVEKSKVHFHIQLEQAF